jgi:outer membrane protein assembly factor BamB
VEAASGAVAWESDLGPETARMEKHRQECREGKYMPSANLDFCSCPLVLDGIVVCNDNAEGLIGLRLETGQRAWGPVPGCIRKTSSPVAWRCGDREYVVAAYQKAVCVDPKTGAVLWEATEGVASEGTPAAAGDYLVLGGGGKKATGLSCFKMSREGATRAWTLGPRYNSHVTSPLIYRGHVYAFWEEETVCVELASGRIAATARVPGVRSCSSLVAADGRVLREHLYQQFFFYRAGPEDFQQLGEWWHPPSHADCTTSTLVDGRLFIRGKDCVYCYDLRKPAER